MKTYPLLQEEQHPINLWVKQVRRPPQQRYTIHHIHTHKPCVFTPDLFNHEFDSSANSELSTPPRLKLMISQNALWKCTSCSPYPSALHQDNHIKPSSRLSAISSSDLLLHSLWGTLHSSTSLGKIILLSTELGNPVSAGKTKLDFTEPLTVSSYTRKKLHGWYHCLKCNHSSMSISCQLF